MPVAYTVKDTVAVLPYNPTELFADVGDDNKPGTTEGVSYTQHQLAVALGHKDSLVTPQEIYQLFGHNRGLR